jgi:hypothetical protein
MQLPQVMRIDSVHTYNLTGELVSCFPVSAQIDRSVAPFSQPFVLYNIVEIHTSFQHRHTHGQVVVTVWVSVASDSKIIYKNVGSNDKLKIK